MTTGELIREARKDAGMTQRELGDACGIAESTIRRYELNKLHPKQETLQNIAAKLKINWLYLLDTDMPLRPRTLEEAKMVFKRNKYFDTIENALDALISTLFDTVEKNVLFKNFSQCDVCKGGEIADNGLAALLDAESYYNIQQDFIDSVKKHCMWYDEITGDIYNSEYSTYNNTILLTLDCDKLLALPEDVQKQTWDFIATFRHNKKPKIIASFPKTETPPEE